MRGDGEVHAQSREQGRVERLGATLAPMCRVDGSGTHNSAPAKYGEAPTSVLSKLIALNQSGAKATNLPNNQQRFRRLMARQFAAGRNDVDAAAIGAMSMSGAYCWSRR
jgi:hypothetical protein